MLPQKVHDIQKKALTEAVVRAVVMDGMENLTTKTIGKISEVSEVYIYRYFENKEDLISKTFDIADEELLKTLLKNISVFDCKTLDFEVRFRVLFSKCWDYLLSNPDWLIFYIRYYYSFSFQKYSYSGHIKRYEGFAKRISSVGGLKIDAKTLLHYLLDSLLLLAEKQVMDKVDGETAKENAFSLLYSAVERLRR